MDESEQARAVLILCQLRLHQSISCVLHARYNVALHKYVQCPREAGSSRCIDDFSRCSDGTRK